MRNLRKAMDNLNKSLSRMDQRPVIPFEEFVKILATKPNRVIRNIFQVFHDMFKNYVGTGEDEYPDDPESIHYVHYDCSKLFVEKTDHPFFADRLFANRLLNHVDAMCSGAQQNKLYIFEGPHGCGKSTFLNNLLNKFEEYTNTEDGLRYEVVWRLSRKTFGSYPEMAPNPFVEKIMQMMETARSGEEQYTGETEGGWETEEYVEVACPSHDNPILIIPKHYRRQFFDDIFENDEFKWRLFTEKEYEWVFRDTPCTICSSLYQAMLSKLKNPLKIFARIYARPYAFNRRLGEGISVFNPGDKLVRQSILTNPMLQRSINTLLRDSNQVKYIFSRHAKTNNGIYALMDIKGHNTERLIELHNIISEGVHKVEEIEENVHSLFFALMNPEDKKNFQDIQSFSDRIEYIHVPYVMDLKTEVEIYRNTFGRHIDQCFLPRVLHNFARVIIATRMETMSESMLEWISDPRKYNKYCDENLQLLKMEIYAGHIPAWLSEEDRKRLNAQRRRNIIAESEKEGLSGCSGRDSIKIFNEFYSSFVRDDKLIDMSMLVKFFKKLEQDRRISLPRHLLDSLTGMYNYTTLHEVKEALYYYNEEQISREIQNYLFAINFEPGAVEVCRFTGDRLEINEELFSRVESRLLTSGANRGVFRRETQREYTSRTLTQDILRDGISITETELFNNLRERYVYNLKLKVLDPFLENENFRRAIKDFGSQDFKTYDKKIRTDVTYLIRNLCTKFHYTTQGAKEVCMYVIDADLAKKFNDR